MLQMGFLLPNVSRSSESKSAGSLRNSPLNSCPSFVLVFPHGSGLLHTDALQDARDPPACARSHGEKLLLIGYIMSVLDTDDNRYARISR